MKTLTILGALERAAHGKGFSAALAIHSDEHYYRSLKEYKKCRRQTNTFAARLRKVLEQVDAKTLEKE